MNFDRYVALSLIAIALVPFDSDEVVSRRVFLAKLPDDFVGRPFAPVGFVRFAIDKKVNLFPVCGELLIISPESAIRPTQLARSYRIDRRLGG